MIETQGKGKKILIIEDEKPIAKALELKLSHEGFETTATFDGESGVMAMKEGSFDLILCDLVMPKMDGFDVLQKRKDANIKTPVIILTNLSQDEDSKKAVELGAKDVFVKSDIPISEIVSYVKKNLE